MGLSGKNIWLLRSVYKHSCGKTYGSYGSRVPTYTKGCVWASDTQPGATCLLSDWVLVGGCFLEDFLSMEARKGHPAGLWLQSHRLLSSGFFLRSLLASATIFPGQLLETLGLSLW